MAYGGTYNAWERRSLEDQDAISSTRDQKDSFKGIPFTKSSINGGEVLIEKVELKREKS